MKIHPLAVHQRWVKGTITLQVCISWLPSACLPGLLNKFVEDCMIAGARFDSMLLLENPGEVQPVLEAVHQEAGREKSMCCKSHTGTSAHNYSAFSSSMWGSPRAAEAIFWPMMPPTRIHIHTACSPCELAHLVCEESTCLPRFWELLS
jgi:hypothetical protein